MGGAPGVSNNPLILTFVSLTSIFPPVSTSLFGVGFLSA